MGKLPDNLKPVICIAGPTASGKSAWAIELAKSVDGEIINADSMQVYGELHILTARPAPKDLAVVPHHMFGHISAAQQYSVGHWLEEASETILSIMSRGKTPILVGGTGLYFKALTEGLANIPEPTPDAVRQTEEIFKTGMEALRAKAEKLDPAASARVLGDDPQRLSRIVSVALGTGKPLSDWQANTKPVIPAGFWHGAVMLPERELLYDRINRRFDKMMKAGGLSEVRSVMSLGLSPVLPAMKAIGVPPFAEYLHGKLSYEEALSRAKRDTRRYAKRQFTWYRGQTKHWFCVKNSNDRRVFGQKFSNINV